MLQLKVISLAGIIVFIAAVGLLIPLNQATVPPADVSPTLPANNPTLIQGIDSFEECVAAANLVFTSNPSRCISPAGKVFVNSVTYQGKVIKKAEQIK